MMVIMPIAAYISQQPSLTLLQNHNFHNQCMSVFAMYTHAAGASSKQTNYHVPHQRESLVSAAAQSFRAVYLINFQMGSQSP